MPAGFPAVAPTAGLQRRKKTACELNDFLQGVNYCFRVSDDARSIRR